MQRDSASKNRPPGLLALRRRYTDPHGIYNSLRLNDPLYFDGSSQSWLVTGHELVTTILDDPRFIASTGSATSVATPGLALIGKQMLFMNGEPHRHAQSFILRPLAQMVKSMPAVIQAIAHKAVQKVAKAGSMDIVSDFASPISLLTIAHVLGIATDDPGRLNQLESWSDTFGDVTSGYFRNTLQDVQHLENYFYDLVSTKKQTPTDDLLSAFIAANDDFFDDEDLVANCMMIFAAGRITTKKLLGNGISLLLPAWEAHQQEFKKDPRYVRTLGEELLRMVTPTRYLIREAEADIHLSVGYSGDHFIRQGQRVMLFLEAADFDPAVFAHPASFQAQRRPNKHIAFGYGPHQCPGATLARMEVQIALEALLTLPGLCRHPNIQPTWNTNPNLGGFSSNPVLFDGNRA